MSRLSKLGYIKTHRTKMPVRRRIRSRGVPAALVDHEIFCTDDPTEASELVGKLLGRTRLQPVANLSGFAASLHAIRLRDVSFGYLDFHVGTVLEVSETGDHYTVQMPASGLAKALYNGESLEIASYQALVVNPGSTLRMDLQDDTPQLLVRIERACMERQLARLMGRSIDTPIVFDPVMDLTEPAAVRWHGAIQLLSAEITTEDSLIQRGLGGGALEELIVTSLLLIQPSTISAELEGTRRGSGRRSVRLSIDYIERHLAEPITLADIAENTHLSVRSIQQGFRDDLGTTPMTYVRDRRLERVREALADALPSDGVTVTDVAERWGFSHLGNFAVHYRKRFGESPSATLRR